MCLCSMAVYFQVCTAKMNLSDEVDLEDYVSRPDKISAAEVSCFFLSHLRFMYKFLKLIAKFHFLTYLQAWGGNFNSIIDMLGSLDACNV